MRRGTFWALAVFSLCVASVQAQTPAAPVTAKATLVGRSALIPAPAPVAH